MKLINRKTNEMACFGDGIIDLRKLGCENVAEMIEAGWEDYEEEPCFISEFGTVHPISCMGGDRQRVKWLKEIGNYYENEEEAKKAVEKFKAWKRLEDEGFMAIDKKIHGDYVDMTFILNYLVTKDVKKDIDLLFRGEE